MKKSHPLAALTAAAMALPAFAAEQPVAPTISIYASSYEEDAAPTNDTIAGSPERYDISIGKFRLAAPVGKQYGITLDVDREIMSGASPWGTITGLDGNPDLIMSGASIKDSRTRVSVSGTQYQDNRRLSLTLARSEEDDYVANSFAASTEWDTEDKLQTWSLGASVSRDKLSPSDASLFGRVASANKRSESLFTGWTGVINRNAVIQSTLGWTRYRGFLSDPYKLRDIRPDERTEWTASARLRYWLEQPQAALHLNYRYYRDDFGVNSQTLELNWHQNLGEFFQLVPGVRYYSQSSADFYTPVDDYSLPVVQAQSSDHRLSAFGAIAYNLKAVVKGNNWTATASFEHYQSNEKYGLYSSSLDHPGLVDFSVASLGLTWQF